MKRMLFYLVLVLQVAMIALLGAQYLLIDHYGKTIKILQEKPEPDPYYYPQEDLYLDYEINYPSGNSWNVPDNIKNDEKVYVLLEADNDGIYHAVEASRDRLKPKQHQVVLAGKYQAYASSSGRNRVDYGIERIREKSKYRKLDQNKQWLITLKIAPWGQTKVVGMDER